MISRLIPIIVLAILFVGFAAVGYVIHSTTDPCAQVLNVNAGSAWDAWHLANARLDLKRGHMTWVKREALDIGCTISIK